jgi:hypothetical protein
MGIANAYSRVIRRQLRAHAAWLPVTNVFALGDYGVVSNGIFTRIGNVANFGVTFGQRSGPPSSLNYKSGSVITNRIEAGAKVDVFSGQAAVDAALKLEFTRKSTFLLKAKIESLEIDDILAVGRAVRSHRDWRWHYRLVKTLYAGSGAVMLASREGATEITLTGKASALQQLDLGHLAVDIGVNATRGLALDIVGGSGVVGLGLVRVKNSGHPVSSLKAASASHALMDASDEIDENDDWDEDPEDDI